MPPVRDIDRREFLTTTGASVVSIAVAGCLGGNGSDGGNGGDGANESNESTGANESNETANERTPPPLDIDGEIGDTPDSLEITSFHAYETIENVGVMGVAENVGNSPLDDIEIEVTLNDGDTVIGEFIDTSTEDIDYLRPGNIWRFDVVFEEENISEATTLTISADAEVVEGGDAGTNETG
ncbi:FxLYD domain-containing protein [Halalkalicoccus salilacus]|uniref:FxLYD domain-containing protein n=1 Tax=Halalkalicoccus salilacus TaxID=3117459 RepID=UPI00300EDE6C